MLSQGEARRIRGLRTRKNREREGLFVAEGVRVVEELIGSGLPLHEVVAAPSVEDTPRGRTLVQRALETTRVVRTTEAELRSLAGTDTPQGVLAVARIPERTLDDVVFGTDDVATRARDLVLVLDAVQDPGNLGTLIRAADAFGAAGVIALPGSVDCWNPKVVRSAAGSLFRMSIVYAGASEVQDWLRRNAVRTYAADAAGSDVDTIRWAARAALIVGNEGAGLSGDARGIADEVVAIRMPGRAESLNVAVAAGILLYAFTRQGS